MGKTKEQVQAELIRFMYMEKGRNMNMMKISKQLNIPIGEVRRIITKYGIFKNKSLQRKYDKSKVNSYLSEG